MTRSWTRPAAWCAAGVLAVSLNPSAPRAQEPAPKRADPTKRLVVERGPTAIVANTAPAAPANPAVEPGKVKWHPSFAAACEAAKKSGKPVLVFHMMGQLDRQFC